MLDRLPDDVLGLVVHTLPYTVRFLVRRVSKRVRTLANATLGGTTSAPVPVPVLDGWWVAHDHPNVSFDEVYGR